ncbi:hypothetical protein PM082_013427 [Marasmius tenuissimus]|nr:hypothetical protein PM082_013427 [Marasmius tenuissimus]
MEETEQPYTRDELVDTITSFYKFLTTFHIPESALKYPSEGGWPNITTDSTAGFGKSPLVVDLLRHLPYIEEDGRLDLHNIHYKCNVLDYSTRTPQDFASDDIKIGEMQMSWDGPVSENVVVVAEGYESGGRNILLDLENGEITVEEIRCGRECQADVKEYFEDLRLKYKRLEIVPVPGHEPFERVRGRDREDEKLKNPLEMDRSGEYDWILDEHDAKWISRIYRDYGWPGPQYRKAEALAAAGEFTRIRAQHDGDSGDDE